MISIGVLEFAWSILCHVPRQWSGDGDGFHKTFWTIFGSGVILLSEGTCTSASLPWCTVDFGSIRFYPKSASARKNTKAGYAVLLLFILRLKLPAVAFPAGGLQKVNALALQLNEARLLFSSY